MNYFWTLKMAIFLNIVLNVIDFTCQIVNIFVKNNILLPTTWKGGDARVVGNIEKRGENSYRLRVSGGYTGEGKRVIYKKTVQAKNKTEAEKELALFISEIETGQALSAKKMRFRVYADF